MVDSNYTHIALILDRSGSMSSIEKDMNGGIKTFLTEQGAFPGTLTVDVTVFDTKIDFLYTNAKVDSIVHPLITPRGGTALFDAVGLTVVRLGERLEKLPEKLRPGKVIVFVVTDGHENSSREWTKDKVKALVDKQTDEFQWEFVFLGANIDSAAVGGGIGIRGGQSLNYVANAAGVNSMATSMSAYATATRSGFSTTIQQQAEEPVLSK